MLMNILSGDIKVSSQDFKANEKYHRSLANELEEHLQEVKKGGEKRQWSDTTSEGNYFPGSELEKFSIEVLPLSSCLPSRE